MDSRRDESRVTHDERTGRHRHPVAGAADLDGLRGRRSQVRAFLVRFVSAALLLAAAATAMAVLPAEVNSAVWLADPASTAVFTPLGHERSCGPAGCRTMTDGQLSGGEHVIWNGRLPLTRRPSVRLPAWAWGTGRYLITGRRQAVSIIVAGIVLETVAGLVMTAVIMSWAGHPFRVRWGREAASGGLPPH